MDDNSKDGDEPKSRGYSARDLNNPKEIQKTVKIRRNHWKEFKRFKSVTNVSFNGFVGDLMEGFFNRKVLDEFVTINSDTSRLSIADYIAVIGNEVDFSKAMMCLVAWLDGTPMPPCEISSHGSDLYRSILEQLKGTAGEGYTHSESYRMLDYLRQFYFYEKAIHLRIYDLSKVALYAETPNETTGEIDQWKKSITDRLNETIDMEYASLNFSCMFSSHVKFSIYDAWYGQKLRTRALQPDWVSSVKDRLEAMNKPFT